MHITLETMLYCCIYDCRTSTKQDFLLLVAVFPRRIVVLTLSRRDAGQKIRSIVSFPLRLQSLTEDGGNRLVRPALELGHSSGHVTLQVGIHALRLDVEQILICQLPLEYS